MAQIWSKSRYHRPNNVPRARIGVFWPDLGHFAWIWAIMLGFGPFCLDLGHIAWIWAIWQNIGQNRPQRRQSPEDGAGGRTDGRTYVHTDEQIPPVFYRTSSPSRPLPKKGSLYIQLSPALADFKGHTKLICFRLNFVEASIRNAKKIWLKELRISVYYKRSPVESGFQLHTLI